MHEATGSSHTCQAAQLLQEINNQVAMANSKAGKAQPGSEAAQRSQLLGESDESAAAQASRRRAWQVGEHLEGTPWPCSCVLSRAWDKPASSPGAR